MFSIKILTETCVVATHSKFILMDTKIIYDTMFDLLQRLATKLHLHSKLKQ